MTVNPICLSVPLGQKTTALTRIESRFHIGQLIPNVIQQDLIERLRQKLCPTSMRDIPIRRMTSKELSLAFQRLRHRFFSIDVLLTSVDYANETEFERVDSTSEDVERVGPVVH